MHLAARAWDVALSVGGAALAQALRAFVDARGTLLPAALAVVLPLAVASYVRSALRAAAESKPSSREGL